LSFPLARRGVHVGHGNRRAVAAQVKIEAKFKAGHHISVASAKPKNPSKR
jgi:hypothetical protein